MQWMRKCREMSLPLLLVLAGSCSDDGGSKPNDPPEPTIEARVFGTIAYDDGLYYRVESPNFPLLDTLDLRVDGSELLARVPVPDVGASTAEKFLLRVARRSMPWLLADFADSTQAERILVDADTSFQDGLAEFDIMADAKVTRLGFEPVEVPAANYPRALHVRLEQDVWVDVRIANQSLRSGASGTLDVWMAEGVGIVKQSIRQTARQIDGALLDIEQEAELTESHLVGGSGVFPLAVGNRWIYHSEATVDTLSGRSFFFPIQFQPR